MENKYFTPDIEDICIGYEYEQLVTPLSESLSKSEPEWMKCKFPDPFTIDRILLLYERKEQLRVPYLTKEQIEAEGWETTDEGVDSRGEKILYKNCKKDLNIFNLKYYLIFNEIEKSLNIYMRKSLFDDSITSNLYNGECKDINTFRKIIKLLKI